MTEVKILAYRSTINSVNRMFIVWFQKILSIPLPLGEFHASPPPPQNFQFFNTNIPSHLLEISTSAMHTPIASGKKVW